MYRVIGHSQCPYCKQAILLLATKGKSFVYLDAREETNAAFVEQMREKGLSTVPQIWVDEEHIGGMTELQQHLA
jgi:glutaredoxin